jgi:hypothetical protein
LRSTLGLWKVRCAKMQRGQGQKYGVATRSEGSETLAMGSVKTISDASCTRDGECRHGTHG